MIRRFTGWHMAAVLALFFGTIILVNITMALFATRTFGGTVVDNSYVASQKFNGWLEAAREQQELGWDVAARLDGARRVAIAAASDGQPLGGIAATALASHPLGRQAAVPLRFLPAGAGRLRSIESLPAGRWEVRIRVSRGRDEVRLIESLS